MNQLRLVLVLIGLWVAIPSMAFAQSASSAAPSSAVTPIGPWFVGALPQQVPEVTDLSTAATIAVNQCPGKAVVCEPLASGDLEDSRWNRIYAQRRVDACLSAVTDAGGAASASGGYRVGPSGEHGRGVELRCASIAVKPMLASLPREDQPITRATLGEAMSQTSEAVSPSFLILGVAGFGSFGTDDGVNLGGGQMTLGWAKSRFIGRANVGFGSSEHGVGGNASLMPGIRITNWLDTSLGPVASASFVDGLEWTSQYFVGAGLGLGLNWSVLRIQLTPQYGAEVDRFQHQSASGRFRFDGNIGLEFWY